jgi:ankyrin repeat protein
LLRAARAGDAPFVDLLLKHGALVDLPSKEGVTPLMAAAGMEFGTRVTRGRNRTDAGILATMKLLVDAGANVNARMLVEPKREVFDASVAQANLYAYGLRSRPSQIPTADAVPDQTAIMAAAERGYTPLVKFLAEHGADLSIKDASGRSALDLARGVGVRGVKSATADPHPETVAVLESLLATKASASSSAQ